MAAKYVPPIAHNATFARVDQGVDYSQHFPYAAIGDGVVYHVKTSGSVGTFGQAVYYKLDHPVTINGRTYSRVYVAETKPLVKVGDRVRAGDPIASGGSAELGFAEGQGPAAPLVGGLGAGTQPTTPGHDFKALVDTLRSGGNPTDVPAAPAAPTPVSAAPVDQSGTQPYVPTATTQAPPAGPPTPESTQTFQPAPGAGIYAATTGQMLADEWNRIASQPGASPDAQLLASNAALLGG